VSSSLMKVLNVGALNAKPRRRQRLWQLNKEQRLRRLGHHRKDFSDGTTER